tara:strand:+ start:1148 stop:1291 length:144 start_codon:yes stop_codon:yes gene_type:complete
MDKVEKAKKLLQELDRLTDRSLVLKTRRMLVLQEALANTRKQLGINN